MRDNHTRASLKTWTRCGLVFYYFFFLFSSALVSTATLSPLVGNFCFHRKLHHFLSEQTPPHSPTLPPPKKNANNTVGSTYLSLLYLSLRVNVILSMNPLSVFENQCCWLCCCCYCCCCWWRWWWFGCSYACYDCCYDCCCCCVLLLLLLF